jgi:taurine dioxygenase
MSPVSTSIAVRPITGSLGAEITGIDCTRPLDDEQTAALRAAIVEHKVVFLRDQRYSTVALEHVTERLGGHGETPFLRSISGHPGIVQVVKEASEGGFNFGGAWHTDYSFQPAPPSFTLLWSVEVPPQGGDTIWSNQALAFARLSPGLQATLRTLRAVHSAGAAYAADGFLARTAAGRTMQIDTNDDALAEVVHPVVTTHPESGQEVLFVNPTYTTRFDGWSPLESKPLLDMLFAHSVREAFTCRFRWTPDTLTIWDNRCTQHLAIDDYRGHRRELYRSTVGGAPPR